MKGLRLYVLVFLVSGLITLVVAQGLWLEPKRLLFNDIVRALGNAERELANGEKFRSNERRTIRPLSRKAAPRDSIQRGLLSLARVIRYRMRNGVPLVVQASTAASSAGRSSGWICRLVES